ncbi:pro-neuregulin-4, membrane-bound isoform [Austrofundulus limnaeus]|uniref:Pro-neuregulin-4, membrane-bound isoform n=1 Tax=Austrofundulus limnaeus TaxID=52670 RepID=A0A2I4BHE8_AUSLI|nr:PREDICTED: pro-neuregulin-4, membrane-bound isoform-like [Austrofundulus limnaeus]
MFTLRKTHLERTLFHTLMVLLLLTTADLAKISSTDVSPPDSNSTLSLNSSMETPKVQFLHRPCGSEHSNYCLHEGKCVYPRDSNDTPSCICKDSYQGPRCETYSSSITGALNQDQLIGIILGVIMVALFLAVLISCYVYWRYRASSSMTKLVPSESSV